MIKSLRIVLTVLTWLALATASQAQNSVARQWSDMMLECIRRHQARPVVAARNLYHASILMYDGWAVYDNDASTLFLGKTLGSYDCLYNGMPIPTNPQAAQEMVISYAMYRFLTDRYSDAPNNNWNNLLKPQVDNLMASLGYSTLVTSTAYSDGDPAKLGNYLAAQLQAYALSDGANQAGNYANNFYEPVNGNLFPQLPGNPNCIDPNRWQPLSLTLQLDQNGFPVPNGQPALGHEWGEVTPFSLRPDQKVQLERDGYLWDVYLDPGPPPLHSDNGPTGLEDDFYKWAHSLVAMWHSFHDPTDGEVIDISPNNIGNVDFSSLPESFDEFKAFYNPFSGGEDGPGYALNPATGLPYETQLVPRGDYTRVLSEYWADGPNSETPPGHWFKLLNQDVHDHPDFERRWMGQGPLLSELEWDVRAYLALGGAIHDAAVACWSAKGFYDSTRPIFAIRYMCSLGQSSDPGLPSYHPGGIPLSPGYIELVGPGDPLAGPNNEHINKIKLYTWMGPEPATGLDGVGWILGENWWTFQRQTFVTPPFAGYYSGHSTYSRTAAEVLTLITGDEYFPGGMSEFLAPANQYLAASEGPSVDIRLQWARYADAADQCSLSRIYGGLHPPIDDIPGRRVGKIVGPQAVSKADALMTAGIPTVISITPSTTAVGANNVGSIFSFVINFSEPMNTNVEPTLTFTNGNPVGPILVALDMLWLDADTYRIRYIVTDQNTAVFNTRIKVTDAKDPNGNKNRPALGNPITFDIQRPTVSSVSASSNVVSDDDALAGTWHLDIQYSEPMSPLIAPTITFMTNNPAGTLTYQAGLSSWISTSTFRAVYAVTDLNVSSGSVSFTIGGSRDVSNNNQLISSQNNLFSVDTRNPLAGTADANISLLNDSQTGDLVFEVFLAFDEFMDQTVDAQVIFSGDVAAAGLVPDEETSGWMNANIYLARYNFSDEDAAIGPLTIESAGARDLAGNVQQSILLESLLTIDTHNPGIISADCDVLINDATALSGSFEITIGFDDAMDTGSAPVLTFNNGNPLGSTLTADALASGWQDASTYVAVFSVSDAGTELSGITITVDGVTDDAGNGQQEPYTAAQPLVIDTRNPLATQALSSSYNITSADAGPDGLEIVVLFDEAMDTTTDPVLAFPDENPSAVLTPGAGSGWLNPNAYRFTLDVSDTFVQIADVDLEVSGALDTRGNLMEALPLPDFLDIHSVVDVEEEVFAGLQVYPNPIRNGDLLYMTMTSFPADAVVRVLNTSGQLIWQESPRTAGGRLALSTAGWSAGLYTIHLTSEYGNHAMRIVVN